MADRNLRPDSGNDLVIEDAGSTDRLRITDGGSTILYEDGGAAALTIDTDGNTEISQHIEQADGKNIQTDEVRARDGDGLKLYDDGGDGVKVVDNGYLDLKMYSDPGGTNFIKTQYTASVSTSATTIATANNFLTYGTFFVICGRDTGSSADRFVDLITASLNGQVNVVASTTARASPKTRTYSLSLDNLKLAMGSGTYRVVLTAFDFHTDTS